MLERVGIACFPAPSRMDTTRSFDKIMSRPYL